MSASEGKLSFHLYLQELQQVSQQLASQQWEWDHHRFRQVPENLQVLQALTNPAACSGEQLLHLWSEQQGLGSNHLAVSSRPCPCKKSSFCDTGQMDDDCCFTRDISLTISLQEFPALGCYHWVSRRFSGGCYYEGVPAHSIYAFWEKQYGKH